MRLAILHIKGLGGYSQSRLVGTAELPKKEKESADAYEERVWRLRTHVDESGRCAVPAMALKCAIVEGAKRLIGEKAPGGGKATWTKHFESGIIPISMEYRITPETTRETVRGETLSMSSMGRKGKNAGARVLRTYPVFPSWELREVGLYVADDSITERIFRRAVEEAGKLIGIGRWRPEVGGLKGRFVLSGLSWTEE